MSQSAPVAQRLPGSGKRLIHFPDTITFSAYGVKIGVRISDPAIRQSVLHCLPPGWHPTRASPTRWYQVEVSKPTTRLTRSRTVFSERSSGFELRTGPKTLVSTADLSNTLTAFESDLKLYVAEMARGVLFVHAGVVGWHGRAIVIPGYSFSGKTTLVASLVEAGATYYSDEYAVLDKDGRVHPFLRPLTLRKSVGQPSPRRSTDWPDGLSGAESLPIGLAVVTQYRPGSTWHPRVLSPGRALLALLAHTVSARRQPGFALRTLVRALAHTLALESDRPEAQKMPAPLFKLLDSHLEALNRARSEFIVLAGGLSRKGGQYVAPRTPRRHSCSKGLR